MPNDQSLIEKAVIASWFNGIDRPNENPPKSAGFLLKYLYFSVGSKMRLFVPLTGHRLNQVLDTLTEIEELEKETVEAERSGVDEEPGQFDWAA